jgi:hypothetical protein
MLCFASFAHRVFVRRNENQTDTAVSDQYTHCTLCQTSTHTAHYVRPVHTLYISYFIEHSGDDKPHDLNKS